MQAALPGKLQYGILRASGLGDEKESQEIEERQDFREDSPFATTKPQKDETTPEDSIHWLHRQGYTYDELYGLLIGEIEQLSEGYKRYKKREEEQAESGNQTTPTRHGNRGDRASELGWR